MKPRFRFLLPLLVIAALALSAAGVAFGREITNFDFFKTRDEIEITGMLEDVDGTTWTVDGQVISVPVSAEIKGTIFVGQVVKIHASMGADGTLTAREVELATLDDVNDNSFDDNANDNFDDDDVDDNANDNSDDDDVDDNANDNDDDEWDDDNANDNSDDDEWDDDNANDNSDDDSDDNSNDNDDDSDEDDDDDNDNDNDDDDDDEDEDDDEDDDNDD